MPPTPHDLTGANAALLLTPSRGTIEAVACGIAWLSGAYTEKSPFPVQVVWVSVVFSNPARKCASRVALVTLN